jgi:hypothetical protein
VLYIIGYFPTMPAANYRYVYWSALAGSLALVLLWAGRIRPGVTDGTDESEREPVEDDSADAARDDSAPARDDSAPARQDTPTTR